MASKKSKRRLPKGNLRAVGRNVALGRAMERDKRINAAAGGGVVGRSGFSLPVHAQTSIHAREQQAGRRPGTGRPGYGWWLPPLGPPYRI